MSNTTQNFVANLDNKFDTVQDPKEVFNAYMETCSSWTSDNKLNLIEHFSIYLDTCRKWRIAKNQDPEAVKKAYDKARNIWSDVEANPLSSFIEVHCSGSIEDHKKAFAAYVQASHLLEIMMYEALDKAYDDIAAYHKSDHFMISQEVSMTSIKELNEKLLEKIREVCGWFDNYPVFHQSIFKANRDRQEFFINPQNALMNINNTCHTLKGRCMDLHNLLIDVNELEQELLHTLTRFNSQH